MKHLRYLVPFLGILALAALFMILPETPSIFGIVGCKTCSLGDPYLPLIGAGYFATIIAVSLIFPTFPGPLIARGGLIWAILIALILTYIKWPVLCPACLIGHACNILIWTIWVVSRQEAKSRISNLRERLCLTLFAPISVVALFSCLNLTFMAYGSKINHNLSSTSLQIGDAMPALTNIDATEISGLVINFISLDCPYCKEQLLVINSVANQLSNGSYRFINVTPVLQKELVESFPAFEWVEDKEGELRELFKISGYPTLFVMGSDGKIAQVTAGVPEQLKAHLLASLTQSKSD